MQHYPTLLITGIIVLAAVMFGCTATSVNIVNADCIPSDTVKYSSAISWIVTAGTGADPATMPSGDTGVVVKYCQEFLRNDPRSVHRKMEEDQRLFAAERDTTLRYAIRQLRGEVRKSAALQYAAYDLSPDSAFVGLQPPIYSRTEEHIIASVNTWFKTPVVTVRVNGRPLRLLFDTGAEITMINRSALEEISYGAKTVVAGVGGDVDATIVVLDSLHVGNLSVQKLPVMSTAEDVLDSPWWTFWNSDPDGILGWDVISKLSFTITELSEIEYHAGSNQLPVAVLAPTSMPIEVCIKGFPGLAWFDSGATYSEAGEIGVAKSKSEVEESSSTRYGVGGHTAQTTHRLKALPISVASTAMIIEDLPIDDELTRFFAYDVVIGADVLRYCRWSYDGTTRTMNLEAAR